jgi:DIL domain
VLNALLYGKEVSTATHGLRIKLAVSRIDEWLAKQDNDIAGSGERLNLLRDAANVLVLDKNLFLDADTITSIFHSLNLVQVIIFIFILILFIAIIFLF